MNTCTLLSEEDQTVHKLTGVKLGRPTFADRDCQDGGRGQQLFGKEVEYVRLTTPAGAGVESTTVIQPGEMEVSGPARGLVGIHVLKIGVRS